MKLDNNFLTGVIAGFIGYSFISRVGIGNKSAVNGVKMATKYPLAQNTSFIVEDEADGIKTTKTRIPVLTTGGQFIVEDEAAGIKSVPTRILIVEDEADGFRSGRIGSTRRNFRGVTL